MNQEHDPSRPLCPFLPLPARPLTSAHTRRLGNDRSGKFYEAALLYGHSLWLRGFPARGILLLNRAMGCDLAGETELLERWPIPYRAMVWILKNIRDDDFVGNPRRHWQHLATRMVEPRKEVRTWRAWACWYLACQLMPDMPADEKQLREEAVIEPELSDIKWALSRMGVTGELEMYEAALRDL